MLQLKILGIFRIFSKSSGGSQPAREAGASRAGVQFQKLGLHRGVQFALEVSGNAVHAVVAVAVGEELTQHSIGDKCVNNLGPLATEQRDTVLLGGQGRVLGLPFLKFGNRVKVPFAVGCGTVGVGGDQGPLVFEKRLRHCCRSCRWGQCVRPLVVVGLMRVVYLVSAILQLGILGIFEIG
jgi:hypothetical protein